MTEWFGEPPSNWTVAPLANYFTERREVGSADKFAPLSVTKDGVVEQLADVAKSADTEQRRIVRSGDFAINSRSDRKGSAGLAPRDGSVSVITTVLKPRGIEPAFAHYLLRSEPFQEEYYRFGSGIVADLWSTRWSAMKAIKLAVPPHTEQHRIASYLDHETAEIDAFIADQEHLIALLEERLGAVLGATALDSPGWRRGNIRAFAKMRTGHTPSRGVTQYWVDASIPWFTLADVWQLREGRKYLGDTKECINSLGLANSAAELLPAGTVVLSRTASVGFTGIMPRPMATSQDFWNWIPGPYLRSEFLWYQLRAMRPYFMSLVQGSTHKTIYQGDAASLSLAVPPLAEQDALVKRLNVETASMNAAIADAREAIALSKERRAALISAAVTGRIDVTERKRVLT